MTSEELKIVNSLRTGQRDSNIKLLYDRFFPKIRKYIMRNSGSFDDAMDVFQDVILALHQSAMSNKLDKYDKLEGFLYVTAKNQWITRKRQDAARANRETMYSQEEHSQESKQSSIEGIQNILSLLGEKCKELLSLSVLTDVPMEEIGERLGFANADVAKATNYRCKKKLQQLMSDRPELVAVLKG